jgi:inositol 3-alpha-galactosyltransferase
VQFTEYEKMMYLDADIQVYANIDHLFDLPDGNFYAVMDCFCEKTWAHTRQYRIGYCQQNPERVPWPHKQLGPPPPAYFNAGMFVSQPSTITARALLSVLKMIPPTPFAEQVRIHVYGILFAFYRLILYLFFLS